MYSRDPRGRAGGGHAHRDTGNLIESGTSYVETGNEVIIERSGDYRRFEYGLFNRLTGVYGYDAETSGEVLLAEYGYNALDLRIYRRSGEGEETHYVFDLAGNRIEEHAEAESDYYVWRNGRHVARVTGDEKYFYLTDHLGTTVALTDEPGQVVWAGEATPT